MICTIQLNVKGGEKHRQNTAKRIPNILFEKCAPLLKSANVYVQ